MSSVVLDHIVVAAATLEQGVAWCEATLGATPGPGGRHPQFGTHNRLLNLSSERYPSCFFEIIAIESGAPASALEANSQQRRWMGLDDPTHRALVAQAPRLVRVVGRSTMLDMHRWGLITVGLKPGDPVAASRETPRGPLAWQILVREDGGADCNGALPVLIQWQGEHPAPHMPPSGLTLESLTLHGVPARARDVLRMRHVDVRAEPGPALRAVLNTPRGFVTLESP
jgi:hypothetical protein